MMSEIIQTFRLHCAAFRHKIPPHTQYVRSYSLLSWYVLLPSYVLLSAAALPMPVQRRPASGRKRGGVLGGGVTGQGVGAAAGGA